MIKAVIILPTKTSLDGKTAFVNYFSTTKNKLIEFSWTPNVPLQVGGNLIAIRNAIGQYKQESQYERD